MCIEFVAVSYFLLLCSSVDDIQVFESLMRLIVAFLSLLQARPTIHPFNVYGGHKGLLDQWVDKEQNWELPTRISPKYLAMTL